MDAWADGRVSFNTGNSFQETNILLMVQKSGDHQLRLVVHPAIYQVLYIPSGAGFLPSTVSVSQLYSEAFLDTVRILEKKLC